MNYLLGPVTEEKLLPNLCLPNGLAGGGSPGADSALSPRLPLPALPAPLGREAVLGGSFLPCTAPRLLRGPTGVGQRSPCAKLWGCQDLLPLFRLCWSCPGVAKPWRESRQGVKASSWWDLAPWAGRSPSGAACLQDQRPRYSPLGKRSGKGQVLGKEAAWLRSAAADG